jgi:hypothetical protein
MALDLEALKGLVAQLETETTEAVVAGEAMANSIQAAAEASAAMETAVTAFKKENDERLAKMAEIIAALQAAMSEG